MVYKYPNDNYYHGEWTGIGPAPSGYASPSNIPEAFDHAAEASLIADQAAENARLHPTVSTTTPIQTTSDVATKALTTQPTTSNSPKVSTLSNLTSQSQKLISGNLQKIFSGSNSMLLVALAVIAIIVVGKL